MVSAAVLRSQSDERLSALASEGNQQAFAVIFDRYRTELRSHAGRIVRADRIDDILQQAMLSAWSAMLAGSEISDLRAWLHRITHNAALGMVTRRGYDDREIDESSPAFALTDEVAEGRLSLAEAMAAIAALPETQRMALTLTVFEGRSGRDAAHQMGMSENAMRQLVHRARSKVRSAVSAVTPLPLMTWAAAGGEAANVGLAGLGGVGGVATIAKVAAVVGLAGATVGVTQAVHHSPSHATVHHARIIEASTGPAASAAIRGVTPTATAALHRLHHAQSGTAGNGQSGAQGGSRRQQVNGSSKQSSSSHGKQTGTNGSASNQQTPVQGGNGADGAQGTHSTSSGLDSGAQGAATGAEGAATGAPDAPTDTQGPPTDTQGAPTEDAAPTPPTGARGDSTAP
jgi:RNA polymerase sigma factor (sigma-70 family)